MLNTEKLALIGKRVAAIDRVLNVEVPLIREAGRRIRRLNLAAVAGAF